MRTIELHVTYGTTPFTRPTTVLVDGVPLPVEFDAGQTFRGVILRAKLETFDASHTIAVEFEDGTRLKTLVEDEPDPGPRGQTSTPADVFVNLTDGMEAATIRAVLNYKNWGTPSA